MYDIIIVGGGPSGLTAALYAGRAGKKVIVLEKNAFGGQITWSPKVENYPAVKTVSGLELADNLTNQVMSYDTELELDEVTDIIKNDGFFTVKTAFNASYDGKTVIIATGARPKKPGLAREDEFIGNGVSFCAVCDGEFYSGRDVAVTGGGNTALQEALYLSKICRKVYLIHRRDEFRGDKALVLAAKEKGNIELVLSAKVTALNGNDSLDSITVENKSGNKNSISIDCLFVAIGHEPENDIFSKLINLTEFGYADSNESCETKTKGIFVSGDCRNKSVRQLTTAMADGAVAALAACSYIEKN